MSEREREGGEGQITEKERYRDRDSDKWVSDKKKKGRREDLRERGGEREIT